MPLAVVTSDMIDAHELDPAAPVAEALVDELLASATEAALALVNPEADAGAYVAASATVLERREALLAEMQGAGVQRRRRRLTLAMPGQLELEI